MIFLVSEVLRMQSSIEPQWFKTLSSQNFERSCTTLDDIVSSGQKCFQTSGFKNPHSTLFSSGPPLRMARAL